MRDKVNVLYYPEFFVEYPTLIKAMLFFDELHVMDRPSLAFGDGRGQMLTIGAQSPLRSYEASFRESGVPFYVHPAPGGPVEGKWYEQIKADVNDAEFLKRFQDGLKNSARFRRLQIQPGNYAPFGDENDVARMLIAVDVSLDLASHGTAMSLFEDHTIRPIDLSTTAGCAKHLIWKAVICSAKLNFALTAGSQEGFQPLADENPYGDLLGAKYARAMTSLRPEKNKVQLTDLSFAIFDELVPAEILTKLSLGEVIKYRQESESAREEFLEHLGAIQSKQAAIGADGDYAGAIRSLVTNEIVPAARTFKNKLQTTRESLFGSLATGTLAFLGSSSAVNVFGDVSWKTLLQLAGAAGAFMGTAAVNAWLAERATRRECGISYILSLDK